MRLALPLLALLPLSLAPGCSADPASSRLQPGQKVAVLATKPGRPISVFPPMQGWRDGDSPWRQVESGDQLTVIRDEAPDEPDGRLVDVEVSHVSANVPISNVGLRGRVARSEVRPAPN